MKKVIILTSMLGLFALAFLFKETSKNETLMIPPSPGSNAFIVGAMSCGDERDYNNKTDLNINLWHKYTGVSGNPLAKWPNVINDSVWVHPDDYSSEINWRVNRSHDNGLMTFFDRPKWVYLAYGQRSDYQADVDSAQEWDKLWWYSYKIRAGNREADNEFNDGQYVLHVSSSESGPGAKYVLKNLYANREQSYGFWAADDTLYNWYIEPRIRIEPSVVQNYPNRRVCRLEVLDWDSTIVDSITIFAKCFAPWLYPNQYNGEYRLEYYYYDTTNPGEISYPRVLPGNTFLCSYGKDSTYSWRHTPCGIDYRIYWYDEVECWIDLVRVENWKAYNLLGTGSYHDLFNSWIQKEVQNVANKNFIHNCYIEEWEYNIIPCVRYLNQKIKEYSSNTLSLTINFNEGIVRAPIPHGNYNRHFTAEFVKRFVIDSAGLDKELVITNYPLIGIDDPQAVPSYIPRTLPSCSINNICSFSDDDAILAWSYTPADYDNWLNDYFDYNYDKYIDFIGLMKQGSDAAKSAGIRFMPMLTAQLWHWDTAKNANCSVWAQREPTNEELKVMGNIAITYGAKGILWFWYGLSFGNEYACNKSYGRALTEQPISWDPVDSILHKRDTNVYGQCEAVTGKGKFNTVAEINDLYKNKWGPYLISFNENLRQTAIFRDETERLNFRNSTYINNLVSYKPGTENPNCWTDISDRDLRGDGLIYECPDQNYVQVATFNTNPGYAHYFMVVNRRCSPYVDSSSEDNRGGRRYMRVWFHQPEYFPKYNSWQIIDLGKERSEPIPFDKNSDVGINLGWFMPGEGKLYKIVPIMTEGGTLIADEVIEDQNFTCEDTVWNDGYDITITGSSDVSFTDSATIIMNGGTFQSGDASGGPVSNKITYTSAVGGHKWGGLRFYDANVKIYNSEFLNIGSTQGNNYAVSTIDCPLNDIRYSIFTSSSDTAGGVNIAFVNYSPFGAPPNSYVMYNNFAMNNSYSRAVQVQGFAGLTEGVYVNGNTMTSNGYATGIFLSTVTGGVIKNNNISGFETAINTMSSTCDLYGNTISNSTVESKGVYAVESSVLNLAPSGSQWTGGMNNISNMKDNSINIDIDASNFLLMGGINAFDLFSSAEEPFHLYGSFVSESYNSNATGNCFKLSGTEINDPELPNNYLTDGYNQVELDFISYNCSQSMPECSDIVSIGNGLYDTIPRMCGGGGGESNSKLKIKNEKFVLTPKQLQDSIKIQMRHRNYTRVKTVCNELIGNYPESIEGISTLQTLYMATVLSDTTIASRSALKAFYEGLILNHGNNEALVEISNYLVQKCKVLLKQYTSALAGFQTIINNNQYNFRGLLARWDYMATSLLMQGQGGGEKPIKNYELGIMNSEVDLSDEALALLDGYDQLDDDKNPYSKEERAAIQKNVRTVNERSKSSGEKRIEKLQGEAKQNNQRAKHELQRINTMKQVIKTEKPKNVIEHIKIVNNDIQTVFGSTLSNKSTSINNIPSVYRLAQNYPNPFNPVTTIKYELPKDSKVKLVVYDLLGREVKTLVNETKSAGYYQLEFNMQNYASGVYFYRIEADDLSGKKFIDAKKMVLVK